MCMTSSRTGWSCRSLRIAGTAFSLPILTSIRAEPSSEDPPQLAVADLERHALLVRAAVQDARHEAGAAQTARRARALLVAGLDLKRWTC